MIWSGDNPARINRDYHQPIGAAVRVAPRLLSVYSLESCFCCWEVGAVTVGLHLVKSPVVDSVIQQLVKVFKNIISTMQENSGQYIGRTNYSIVKTDEGKTLK